MAGGNTGYFVYNRIVVRKNGIPVSGSPVEITEENPTTTDIINAVLAATGETLSANQAQTLLDSRRFLSDDCFVCEEVLEPNEVYVFANENNESAYVYLDGEDRCWTAQVTP